MYQCIIVSMFQTYIMCEGNTLSILNIMIYCETIICSSGNKLHIYSCWKHILANVLWPMYCGQCILANVLWPMYSGQCILASVFWPMYSGQCIVAKVLWPMYSGQCILANVLWPMYSGQCILANVLWPMYFGQCILANVSKQWPDEQNLVWNSLVFAVNLAGPGPFFISKLIIQEQLLNNNQIISSDFLPLYLSTICMS